MSIAPPLADEAPEDKLAPLREKLLKGLAAGPRHLTTEALMTYRFAIGLVVNHWDRREDDSAPPEEALEAARNWRPDLVTCVTRLLDRVVTLAANGAADFLVTLNEGGADCLMRLFIDVSFGRPTAFGDYRRIMRNASETCASCRVLAVDLLALTFAQLGITKDQMISLSATLDDAQPGIAGVIVIEVADGGRIDLSGLAPSDQ